MDAVTPWSATDDDAAAMYAYLSSLPGASTPVPFTVVHAAPDVPPGSEVQGRTAFNLACKPCHGELHTGAGKIADRRLIVLRKIREGGFNEIGGNMPPFSREVLSDDDVAGILSFLGRY